MVGMSYPYQKILGQTKFNAKNLFLTPHQVTRLLQEKKLPLEMININLSTFMVHLDPKKKTVVIELDGHSGLILAHQLSLTNEFNIVCITKQQNLNKLSSGSAPFYDRVTRTYSNNLNWLQFGAPSRLAYLWNQYRSDRTHVDSVFSKMTALNKQLFDSAFLKEVQPTEVEYEVVDEQGNLSKAKIFTFQKRYLLQQLVHAMTFKKYPDLIINSLEAMRPVYIDATNSATGRDENNRKRYIGHFTNKGMIVGDYYILSTETESLDKSNALGLHLPIAVGKNTVEDLKTPASRLDEQQKVLSLGTKALRAGKHGPTVVSLETTPDMLPIVDKLRDSENVYLNLGYGGNTMATSMAGAQCIIADLRNRPEDKPAFCGDLSYKRFYFSD